MHQRLQVDPTVGELSVMPCDNNQTKCLSAIRLPFFTPLGKEVSMYDLDELMEVEDDLEMDDLDELDEDEVADDEEYEIEQAKKGRQGSPARRRARPWPRSKLGVPPKTAAKKVIKAAVKKVDHVV